MTCERYRIRIGKIQIYIMNYKHWRLQYGMVSAPTSDGQHNLKNGCQSCHDDGHGQIMLHIFTLCGQPGGILTVNAVYWQLSSLW